MPEFNAAGVPGAAHPVTGPIDIHRLPGGNKALVVNDDIGEAIKGALKLKREDCIKFAKDNFSQDKSATEWLTLQKKIKTIASNKILKLALKK
jgi:hypothetical protein